MEFLLRLFPSEFRADHGREIEQVFHAQQRDAAREGRASAWRLWAEFAGGIFRTAPREHWAILRQDAGYALRMMRKNPGFTAIAVLVLALGIGANTAIFSMVHGVLLQPLPYASGDRVVFLRQQAPKAGIPQMGFSPLELEDYRRGVNSFDALVEYHTMSFILLGKAEPERVQVGVVSAKFFDVLGLPPLLGRTFRAEDEVTGAEAVLVLSHAYWQRSHGGDPAVVGRVFRMNDRPHTVIGVLPPVPQFPDENDVYMALPACPFRSNPQNIARRTFRLTTAFGRLKPGVELGQAQAELSTVAHRMEAENRDAYPKDGGFGVRATPLKHELTENARKTFLILLGTAGLVLLIVCANAANLMLSRVLLREREMAIRAALGASRARLLRQIVTESTMLAMAGGALGLFFASAGLDLQVRFAQRFTPRAAEIQIDGLVLLFTLAVSVGTGILFGAIPAGLARRDLLPALGQGSGRTTAGAGGMRLRAGLVVAQVAVSFALVIGAGLMVRSLAKLVQVDAGFRAERVLTAQINLNWSRYQGPDASRNFGNTLLENLRALPGVQSAALAFHVPLQPTFNFTTPFIIEGRELPAGEPPPRVKAEVISANYFATVGQPLVRGREFTAADTQDAPRVVIINQALARRFWPDSDPIGHRVSNNREVWWTIVGVAGDVKQFSLEQEAVEELYIPFAQSPGISSVLVRASRDPGGLEREVRSAVYTIDPEQSIYDFRTLENVRSESLAPKRLTTTLIGLFAAIALVITAAGLAGVMALSVSQRTQEIGIRMALGATPESVLRMVLGQALRLVALGLVAGVAGALALAHLMRGLLYGVAPTDPLTYAAVALVLLVSAALACYAPARRAATIEPMRALRFE